jgi:streptomycin 6-kinase
MSSMSQSVSRFAQRIIDVHEEVGRAWLARLPSLIEQLAARWAFEPGEPYDLSYNFAMRVRRLDGMPTVLKLGVPGPDFHFELDALRWFDGHGSVAVLESDRELGAMLLEQLVPGTLLSTVDDDDAATIVAGEVMATLWRPAPVNHGFRTTTSWTRELGNLRRACGGGTGPFPRRLVERAEHLFAELAQDDVEAVVLHGDLHHDNILAAARRPWLAIDPKGVVGERAYETGALLRNPMSRLRHARVRDLIARRADLLSERLTLDRQRVLAFGFAQLVLAAWWAFEDHGDGWQDAIALAEDIEPLVTSLRER